MNEGQEPMIDGQRADLKRYVLSDKHEADLRNRFTYHSPKEDQLPRYAKLRNMACALAIEIAERTPTSREQSLALTKLEEAVMFANAAIARNEP
jgi:hypothetical protein